MNDLSKNDGLYDVQKQPVNNDKAVKNNEKGGGKDDVTKRLASIFS